MKTEEILQAAKAAKAELASLSSQKKNEALAAMANAIEAEKENILKENALDLEAAKGSVSDVMLDRLCLSEDRIAGMAEGIRALMDLPDPVGRVKEERTISGGMRLRKVLVPMGVVAIIYESRPNVTSDAAALCLKSGNVCILRGGKEAYRSSHAIVKAMQKGLKAVGITENAVQILDDLSRAGATALMQAKGFVDLLIPRGGAGLIRACVEQASVPVIETGTGICSVYVDGDANQEKALLILENAKTQRPSVCNACECCLVQKDIAPVFLPKLQALLVEKRREEGKIPVELRLDPEAAKIIPGTPAGERDFDTEFLDYILAVKTVSGVQEAVKHIALHSTGHSESIITENPDTAKYFTSSVDSAAVYVNVSTRFTDGGCFGLGCEMGISTQKLHARGPMGLEELTSYKYIIEGNGQIRK